MKYGSYREKCLRRFAKQIEPEAGLRQLVPDAGPLEGGAAAIELEHAQSAVDNIEADRELSAPEMNALEAIVMPQGRPALYVIDDSFGMPPPPWTHLHDAPIKTQIDKVIPSIGRIEAPEIPGLPYAGTGFVVGKGLLMTNRHVANVFARGVGMRSLRFKTGGKSSQIDFKRERESVDGTPFDIQELLMVHPFWDMALFAVRGLDEAHPSLTLAVTPPEDVIKEDIVVIGYPAKDYRNKEELQDRIFDSTYNVKRLQPGKVRDRRWIRSFGNIVSAMTHDSSTLGGNSGSAIVRVATGEVIALHFAGLFMDANFAVPSFELARDARVVEAGVNFAGAVPATTDWDSFWNGADTEKGRRYRLDEIGPVAVTRTGVAPAGATVRATGNSVSVTVPVTITVTVGDQPVVAEEVQANAAAEDEVSEADTESTMRISPAPDYENRPGYQPEFLGADSEIPLPWLSQEQYADAVMNSNAEHSRHVLKYFHYSLVMSRSRRLAYYTAANIDGRKDKTIERRNFTDKWFLDPRIDSELQYENDAYVGRWNKLDRGHLVRRLDTVWGRDVDDAKLAHDDTFHWTNCSPQHEQFNRNRGTWGGIENYILHNANNRNLKVTVLTGPVFRDDDPVLIVPSGTEVAIPLEFWKVVAMVKQNDELSATAYRVSQEQLIGQFLDNVEFAFGAFKTLQVPVTEIEALTGLSFHHLRTNDPLATTEEGLGVGQQELRSLDGIVL